MKGKEHLFHTSVFIFPRPLHFSCSHCCNHWSWALHLSDGCWLTLSKGVWSWRPLTKMLWFFGWRTWGWNPLVVARWIYAGHAAYKNKGVFFMWALIFFYTHTLLSFAPTFVWNTSVLFAKHVWKIKELNYASSLVETTLWLWIRNEWITANTHCISEMTHSESWII